MSELRCKAVSENRLAPAIRERKYTVLSFRQPFIITPNTTAILIIVTLAVLVDTSSSEAKHERFTRYVPRLGSFLSVVRITIWEFPDSRGPFSGSTY